MDGIGSRPRGQVHDSPIEAPEFRTHRIGFHVEFLDIIDDGEERHLARFRLQSRDSIEQVLIGARTAAVDAARAKAVVAGGVLRISVPRLDDRRGRVFEIPVERG